MDTDGVQDGFDCALTRTVSRATHIPIIASGGAGTPEHFVRVLTDGCADAALAASIFHYGTYTVTQLKEALDKRGIPVRPPVGQDCILRGDCQSPPACQGRLEIGRRLKIRPTEAT